VAIRTIEVPFRDDYNIGVGADLASGSPMGFVVDGTAEGVQSAGGATVNFTVRRIHATEELHRSLGIDAEASFGSGLFGAGGFSARFSFSKDCAVQTSSLFLLLNCRVGLEHLSIKAPRLTSSAAQLIDKPQIFAERFGNMFVRGLDRGGLFVGVFRLDVHSERDQQDISADLEGSYGLFSASAAMKFNEVRSKFRCDALVSMYHEGGPVDLQITDPTVPSQLLDNANRWLRSFQDDPARNAVPYSVTLAPLTIAEGPLPPNTADIEHAQDVLVLCAKKRSQVLDQINLLSFILAHQSSFDWTGDPTPTPASVDAALNGFEMDLDLVAECASLAINHPADAVTPAKFASNMGQTFPAGMLPSLPQPKPIEAVAPQIPQTTVTVPDVLDEDVTQARATLENLGLQVSTTIQAVPGLLPNVVGFQEPNIGSVVPLGTTISLVVGQ
jgi:PASTA domain